MSKTASEKILKVEDALKYLDQVKKEFENDPHIYNEFLEIMKNFKSQAINTPGVIERVKVLFFGYNQLILDFNTFLPDGEGYKIELTEEELLQGQRHQQQKEEKKAREKANLEVANSIKINKAIAKNKLMAEQKEKNVVPLPGQSPTQSQIALDYIENVRRSFKNKPQVFEEFLAIVNKLTSKVLGQKGESIDGEKIYECVNRVKKLFIGYNELIVAFNNFLPDDQYKIELTQEELDTPQLYVPKPAAVSTKQQNETNKSSNIINNNSSISNNNGNSTYEENSLIREIPTAPITDISYTQLPVIDDRGKPAVQIQQEHAISYVTCIKNRFAHAPEIYRAFLKILHTYQKEQKGIKDVLESVSKLFADHPDLLIEFTYFLPDAVQDQAKERLHRAARESEERRQLATSRGLKPQGMINQNLSMKRGRDPNIPKHISKAQNQANSKKQMLMEKNNFDMNKQMYLQQQQQQQQQQQGQRPPTKAQKNKASKEFSSLSSGGDVINSNMIKKNKNYINERQIFEKIKNVLYTAQSGAPNSSSAQSIYNHNRCIWIETVKCMELYNSDVINKKELLGLIQFILGTNHSILFEEFKKILLCKVDDNSQVSSNSINYGPLNQPLGGLDVSKLEKCSTSYSLLPSEYDHGTFSERTAEDMKVLNNVCISSSNSSVNNQSYKNKYEEILLKCDEERFEIDMIIDSNKSTIDVLEPIIDEIQDFILSKERKSKYKRDKHVFEFDMDILKSVHLFAISRIYGENGDEAIELLKKNPTAAIPVFLRRLKQKDIEWCKIRTDLTNNWKELQLQNYDNSFNFKSHNYIFKEKLFYNSRSIINEVINNRCDNNGITTIDLKNIGVYFNVSDIEDVQSSYLINTFKPNILLTYSNRMFCLNKDIYQLLYHTTDADILLSIHDKQNVITLMNKVFKLLFNLPIDEYTSDKIIHREFKIGEKIISSIGDGEILSFDGESNKYKIKLDSDGRIGYLRPSVIYSKEGDGIQSSSGIDSNIHPNSEFNIESIKRNFIGNQKFYIFLRLHQLLFQRLSAILILSDTDVDNTDFYSNKGDVVMDTGDKIDALIELPVSSSDTIKNESIQALETKSSYRSLLIKIANLIDTSIDISTFEKSTTEILGEKVYLCHDLHKLIQQLVHCLHDMINDVTTNKLIDLYAEYQRFDTPKDCTTSFVDNSRKIDIHSYTSMGLNILRSSVENIFRFQISVPIHGIKNGFGMQIVAIQHMGTGNQPFYHLQDYNPITYSHVQLNKINKSEENKQDGAFNTSLFSTKNIQLTPPAPPIIMGVPTGINPMVNMNMNPLNMQQLQPGIAFQQQHLAQQLSQKPIIDLRRQQHLQQQLQQLHHQQQMDLLQGYDNPQNLNIMHQVQIQQQHPHIQQHAQQLQQQQQQQLQQQQQRPASEMELIQKAAIRDKLVVQQANIGAQKRELALALEQATKANKLAKFNLAQAELAVKKQGNVGGDLNDPGLFPDRNRKGDSYINEPEMVENIDETEILDMTYDSNLVNRSIKVVNRNNVNDRCETPEQIDEDEDTIPPKPVALDSSKTDAIIWSP